jgi:hypothetical protein
VEDRRLQVEIVTVPAHGTLRETIGKRVLSAGDILNTNLTSSMREVQIEYTSDADYFSTPSTEWDGTALSNANDYFTFRARAIDDSQLVSVTTRMSIEVINVNDASILTGPQGDLSVYAFSILDGDDDGLDQFPTTLTLSGIDLTSVDGDVDFVKVRITCEYGKIYINDANLSKLDFTSSQYCYSQVRRAVMIVI